MNCEQVKEQVSAYLDNALAPETHRAVALHLQTCLDCRALLADYRYYGTLIAHLPRFGRRSLVRRHGESGSLPRSSL